MTINEALRLIAGIMTLLSITLAITVNINWLWFTAFIGVNLLQSAFTKWCPMMSIFTKSGPARINSKIPSPGCRASPSNQEDLC